MIIPDELVALVRERRVIPFIGAGFSAGLGLPSWEGLLRQLASATEGTADFDTLMKDTNSDLLQVAEYLYLKNDRHIGPMRHALERGLSAPVDPTTSGVHIELLNLQSQQIYTTNYDDLIEDTFQRMSLPVTTVVLPKDVALSDNKKTQVVKYHGDLRHENTLVLTESAYYKRLDFESPMDLKFRSDLLGKSVLFMGYSFRDINIRIIWFKLMEMMKDIPEADRVPSYIVRAQPNAVLEELYRAVGLRTIVLTEESGVLSDEERTGLHGEFLMRLAEQARFQDGPRIMSAAKVDQLAKMMDEMEERYSPLIRSGRAPGIMINQLLSLGESPGISVDSIPTSLTTKSRPILHRFVDSFLGFEQWKLALEVLERFGASKEVTSFFARAISSGGNPAVRTNILEHSDLPWEKVWGKPVPDEVVLLLVDRVRQETYYHQHEGVDLDLAFAVDILKRALSGQICKSDALPDSTKQAAEDALAEASAIYPSIDTYEPGAKSAPDPSSIIDEIVATGKLTETPPSGVRRRVGTARPRRIS